MMFAFKWQKAILQKLPDTVKHRNINTPYVEKNLKRMDCRLYWLQEASLKNSMYVTKCSF